MSRPKHAVYSTATDAERVAFIQRLPLVHEEAMRLGLPITAHAIHDAVKLSGYELAGDFKACEREREKARRRP